MFYNLKTNSVFTKEIVNVNLNLYLITLPKEMSLNWKIKTDQKTNTLYLNIMI
jgi:hypothetical protein